MQEHCNFEGEGAWEGGGFLPHAMILFARWNGYYSISHVIRQADIRHLGL